MLWWDVSGENPTWHSKLLAAIARLGTLKRENQVVIGSNYVIHHTSRVIATQVKKKCRNREVLVSYTLWIQQVFLLVQPPFPFFYMLISQLSQLWNLIWNTFLFFHSLHYQIPSQEQPQQATNAKPEIFYWKITMNRVPSLLIVGTCVHVRLMLNCDFSSFVLLQDI